MGEGGGVLRKFLKALIIKHPVNQLTKKYFKHLKTKNFTNEGCLCRQGQFNNTSRGNHELFLQSRKSRIGRETHEEIVSLQCFERIQSVIRENIAVYTFCFSIFTSFPVRIGLDHNLHIFLNNLFNFSNTSSGRRQ